MGGGRIYVLEDTYKSLKSSVSLLRGFGYILEGTSFWKRWKALQLTRCCTRDITA